MLQIKSIIRLLKYGYSYDSMSKSSIKALNNYLISLVDEKCVLNCSIDRDSFSDIGMSDVSYTYEIKHKLFSKVYIDIYFIFSGIQCSFNCTINNKKLLDLSKPIDWKYSIDYGVEPKLQILSWKDIGIIEDAMINMRDNKVSLEKCTSLDNKPLVKGYVDWFNHSGISIISDIYYPVNYLLYDDYLYYGNKKGICYKGKKYDLTDTVMNIYQYTKSERPCLLFNCNPTDAKNMFYNSNFSIIDIGCVIGEKYSDLLSDKGRFTYAIPLEEVN